MTRRTAAWVAIVIALAAWGVGDWSARPPSVAGVGSDDRFSLERLLGHVDVLAAEPRPPGTAAHRAARLYIVAELEALGLEVDLQESTFAAKRRNGHVVAGRITNVVARLRRDRGGPAADVGGAVGLLAHYDSRPNTPGAADNAAGVATVLETLTVLATDPGIRRDVIAIFTDAEEVGLLGARAFLSRHDWADDLSALVNVEARGRTGPSLMFETTPGNGPLAAAFANAAPFPLATSLSYEVYRRMPNDTDFSPFRDRPLAGYNFAFIGGHPAYHSALDTPAGLDRLSVRHQARNVLSLALYLAGLDHSLMRGGEDAVFFTLPGWRMVVYPVSTAPRLALATMLLAAAALWRSRRAVWSPGGLLRGVAVGSVAPVLGFIAGSVVWELVALLPGGVLDGPHRRPHEPLWFAGSAALLTVVLIAHLTRRLTREMLPLELLAGVQIIWTLVALVVAWTVPGASYLFTWPAAVAWIFWWLVARAGGGRREAVVLLVTAAGALSAAVLCAPVTMLLLDALTLSGLSVAGALFAFVLTFAAPQLAVVAAGKRSRRALLLVAIVMPACGLLRSGPHPDRPHVNSLFYVADGQEHWWYSADRKADAWTRHFLGVNPERLSAPRTLLMAGRSVLRGPAPELVDGQPSIDILEASRDSGRRRQLELRPGIGGGALHVRLSSPGLDAVHIGGERFEVDSAASTVRVTLVGTAKLPWRLGLDLDEEDEGRDVLEVEVIEQRYGLPDGVEAPGRPPTLIPDTSWRTDSTFAVTRSHLPLDR